MKTLKVVNADNDGYLKPLDVLIEELGHAEPVSRYGDVQIMMEDLNDALHYLREYRETKKHLACLDDAEIRGDNTQIVNNPPLSWDELRTMEGMPVWVEGTILLSHWLIIDTIDEYMMVCSDRHRVGVPLFADVLGKCWQAYRKERE